MTPSIEALVKAAEAFLDDARKHTGALWTKNHELNFQAALANLKGEQTEPDGKTLLGHTKAEWEFHINELFAAALDGEEIPEAALLYGWQGKLTAEDFDWAKRKLAELATPKPAPEPLEFRTKSDPEANGRAPQKGEQRFSLKFPLEDGRELIVHEGLEGMNHFAKMIAQMMVDDQEEADGK